MVCLFGNSYSVFGHITKNLASDRIYLSTISKMYNLNTIYRINMLKMHNRLSNVFSTDTLIPLTLI